MRVRHEIQWFTNPYFNDAYKAYGKDRSAWIWEDADKEHEFIFDAAIISGQENIENMGLVPPVANKDYEVTVDVNAYAKLVKYKFHFTDGKLVDSVFEVPRQ